ncbi:peptide/nickel transport system ATP-binding protein [Albimonas donghaensis]|uniref:Peptide/nickel transport system ATP-binding protein n=1 Tax=Albimonas donghaensis TaxID=356660 RepID=A0A1H3BJ37_9RHOB|nr:oligopeptide/dipeptide ABC transporter ATP-binding protein [Albimonas donghaensis]SDX41728.1 peptide/nickel transport system ATP-binding protein [Albimonas donghaensis]
MTVQERIREDHAAPAGAFLDVRDMVVEYPLAGGAKVHAVSGISFQVAKGETLGLVGESGCGKSSAARAVLQLPRPTSGAVRLGEEELTHLRGAALQRARRRFQMIFQDPIASLNPRRRIRDIVAAPLEIVGEGDRAARYKRVAEMLDLVGLNADQAMERRPHEFSGGQCQRISIARALILRPDLLVCDEPVSALDVSVQAQILNLLEDLKHRFGLTLLFISHDLAVVKHVSDRVAVMYLGMMCETADAQSIYRRPAHPYTRTLLSAAPEPDPGRKPAPLDMLAGELPSPVNPPSGCRFRTRCPMAQARCAAEVPQMRRLAPGHAVACHFPLQ